MKRKIKIEHLKCVNRETKEELMYALMRNQYSSFNNLVDKLPQKIEGVQVNINYTNESNIDPHIRDMVKSAYPKGISRYTKTFSSPITLAAFIASQVAVRRIVNESTNKKNLREKVDTTASICYMNENLRHSFKGLYISLAATIIFLILSFFYTTYIPLCLGSGVLVIMIFARQELLKYRIENGFFGTNYYEAKQLLEFLSVNKDKFDGGNKIFNTEGVDEVIIRLGNNTYNQRESL